MPLYRLSVVEVRHVPCTYEVEADSAEEAIDKASIGDTYKEWEDSGGEVNDRFVNENANELLPIDEGED